MKDELPRLKRFVAEQFYREPEREIADEEPLVSSGVVDSFGLVDLALFAEREFGAAIAASDLGRGRADTARDIAALIAARRR